MTVIGGTMIRRSITRTTPGIYYIYCVAIGKYYIGSSNNILNRWKSHVDSLMGNTHDNYRLQADWNRYGIETFVFSVIESCSIDELQSREQLYLDTYDSAHIGYNICEKVYQPPHTPESSRKQSESLKRNTAFIESSRKFMTEFHRDPEKQQALIDAIVNSPKSQAALAEMNASDWHHKQVLSLLKQIHSDPRIQNIVKTQAERNAVLDSWRIKHNVRSILAIDAKSGVPYRGL